MFTTTINKIRNGRNQFLKAAALSASIPTLLLIPYNRDGPLPTPENQKKIKNGPVDNTISEPAAEHTPEPTSKPITLVSWSHR